MSDWDLLTDAYGSAGEVPTLLGAARKHDAPARDELWGRLCHQGTVSTASYAAISFLAELAVHAEPGSYNRALRLRRPSSVPMTYPRSRTRFDTATRLR